MDTALGIILLLNRGKPEARREQILLINAAAYFVKERTKNVLTQAGINAVAETSVRSVYPKITFLDQWQFSREVDVLLSETF